MLYIYNINLSEPDKNTDFNLFIILILDLDDNKKNDKNNKNKK